MPFPTTGVLDNFNRANTGPPLGGNWTELGVANQGFKIVSQHVEPAVNSTTSGEYWNAATFGADCEVYITVLTVDHAGDYAGIALFARLSGANGTTPDGYEADFIFRDGASTVDKIQIYRIDDGVNTQLGADITGLTFANNDVLGLEVIGSTIKVYQNGTERGSRTDGTYTSAGNIGMLWWYNLAANTDLDDFGGGTITGGGTTNITPAEATQSQTSDAVSIVAITPITPEEATQAQASDAAVVTLAPQQWEITPAEATQAQASDAAGLIYLVTGYGAYIQGISDRAPVYYLIATAEGAQAQASDAAVLSGATPSIAPAEATQAQASDAASITAISPITPAEALQAQASDAASLTAIYLLTPAEATQSQISDAATLGQFTPIDPAEATQAQASDAATIVAISPVTPAEAAQAQSSDAVTLTAIYPVTSAEATQTQISDAASIAFYAPGESIPITPAEALQAQTSDAVTITAIYPLAPSEATQSQTSDAATITAVYPVTVSEATQTQISDAVSLTYYEPLYSIVPEDATQAQLSDAVTLAVVYVLTVADATQAQISDLAVLTSPITAYPPGQRRLHTLDTRGESELAVRGNSVFATRTTLEVDD